MRIGVFDSGMGGKSVASTIQKAFPNDEVIFVSDQKNVPYGSKSPSRLYKLVLPILQELASQTDVIVIACNTVSTTLAKPLREAVAVPLVTLVPMVKPAAALTKTKIIAVCATPTTLASPRYAELKEKYASNIQVLEPDCSAWSSMIETNAVDQDHIKESIESVLEGGADVIVLGCTHYHWIEDIIRHIAAGRATVIQPEQAIVRRLKTLTKEL